MDRDAVPLPASAEVARTTASAMSSIDGSGRLVPAPSLPPVAATVPLSGRFRPTAEHDVAREQALVVATSAVRGDRIRRGGGRESLSNEGGSGLSDEAAACASWAACASSARSRSW